MSSANRLPKLILVTIILLTLLSVQSLSPAAAHPADQVFQSSTLRLTPDGAWLEWSLNPGPLLVPSVWAEADQDENSSVDQTEALAWAESYVLARTFTLDQEIDLEWTVEVVEWPAAFSDFQIGGSGIQVFLYTAWPMSFNDTHRLDLHNHFQEEISTNWYVVHGDDGLAFQTLAQENAQLSIEIALPDTNQSMPDGFVNYWDSGIPSLPPGTTSGEVTTSPENTSRLVTMLTDLITGTEISLTLYPAIFIVAIVLGAFHALTPGHGKALVGAYLIGAHGTPRHAVALGSIVTLTHTGSVLLVGALTLIASRYLVPTTLFPFLEVTSGLLIVVMGVVMLRNRWRGYRQVRRRSQPVLPPPPYPEKTQVIAIDQDIALDGFLPTSNDVDNLAQGRVTWHALLTLGISGGMVPCPDAIAVLLVAFAIQRVPLGLALIFAFSLGLAVILIVIGLIVVRSRRLLDRFDRFTQFSPALPLLSALAVLLLGLVVMIDALGSITPNNSQKTSVQPAITSSFDIDQARIAYLVLDDVAGAQLFTNNAFGTQPQALLPETINIWQYALSPDGKKIIYTPMPDLNSDSSLWMIHSDGTHQRQLMTCEGSICDSPVWSPDNQYVIYQRQDLFGLGLPSLWWLDIASGETKPLFQDSQMPGSNPTWSPDGQWISYFPPDGSGIRLFNLSNQRMLTVPSRSIPLLTWSPSADSVVFIDLVDTGDNNIDSHLFRFELDTGSLIDISAALSEQNPASINSRPVWSPDGEWLAYVRREPQTLGTQVWLMRPDGSEAHPVTVSQNDLFLSPVWSPDSRYLLVTSYPSNIQAGEKGIWLIDIQTGVLQEVVSNAIQPGWLP